MSRIRILCLLSLTLVAGSANAQWLSEVRAGILAHDIDHSWAAEPRESGIDANVELRSTPLLQGRSYQLQLGAGASINSEGATSKLYFDPIIRLAPDITRGIYCSFGGGVAIHDNDVNDLRSDRKVLGTRVLFHVPIEVGYTFNHRQGISLFFDHISNGQSSNFNEGLDTFGLRFSLPL